MLTELTEKLKASENSGDNLTTQVQNFKSANSGKPSTVAPLGHILHSSRYEVYYEGINK